MQLIQQIWAKWEKAFSLMLIFTIYAYCASAQLSGTYTINGSGTASSTNYLTFASAVSDMVAGTRADGGTANGPGVSGAVTFNVANGTYTEQLTIRPISGASATNRVTFQSASGDSSKAVLTYASSGSSTNNFTLQLDSTDYVTFRKLTLERTGSSTYGRVIEVRGGANYNQFLNNIIRGTISTSTTSSAALIYSASGTGSKDDNNIFRNNLLKHGSYGFYYFGQSSSIHEYGTVIEGNLIDSTNYHAIDLENQDSAQVLGNIITNVKGTSAFGMNLRYLELKSSVRRNKIDVPNGTKGIHLEYTRGTASNPQLIANNFIALGGTSTSGRGLDIDYNQYLDFFNNSVNMYGTGATASAVYLWSGTLSTYGNITLKNNIFANTGGGYVVEVTSNAVNLPYIDTSNYNDFYTTGSTFGKWGTTVVTDLAGWRTASGHDANSVSVNPRFVSKTDLHARAAGINGKATPVPGVTTDIDGQARSSTTPDIGADEFTPPPVDAALTLFVSPSMGACAGTQNVTVRIRNAGTTRLDTVTITYILDGVQQTSKEYYPNLTSANTTDLVVGTVVVSNTSKSLKVFVSDPNNLSDADPSNDTITMSISAGLTGTYTIGGSGADYSTFTAAVNDLNARGICGAVTFNVANGTYYEKLSIPAISGASATSTITFQSASGDSSMVNLTDSSSASSTNNYTLLLDGADFITFRNMTISRPGTESYGRVIEIGNEATNNKFLNNRIISGIATSTTANRANIYSTSDNDTNNTFRQNLIKYGSYAIYYRGTGSTSLEKGTVFENNIVDSAYSYGIYVYYQDGAVIRGNKVNNFLITTTAYGIYSGYNDNAKVISNNQVILPNSYGYGIYVYYNDGASSARGLVANNMITVAGTSTAYGISLYYSTYQDIVYNSVLVTSSSTTAGRAFYGTSSSSGYSDNKVINNNFVNTGGGVAYEITTNAVSSGYIDTSDYNNLYSTGSVLASWGSTDVSNLAAWKTASGQDPNSVSANPAFVSETDLHAKSPAINNKAVPFSGVTNDYDGQSRSTSTPDIGADEFTPPANDLALLAIVSPANKICGDSTTEISVVITNFGTNSQSNFNVVAAITGSASQTLTQNYSGTLASLATDTVTFSTTLNTYQGGTFNVAAYTNLSTDQDRTNDTVKTTFVADPIPANPTVSNVAVCAGNKANITAGKPSGSTLQWFTSPTANVPVFTGDTFTTPVLTSGTTYYVSAAFSAQGTVGPSTNTSVSTSGGPTKSTYKVFFDAHSPLKLDSVAVIANGTGTVTIELYDASNTLITSAAGNVATANVKVFIPLGFTVPAGNGYYLQLNTGNTTPSLYRNTSGASYPYTANAVSITGNSFGTGYYYYFYDWHFTATGCPSPRVPVTVTVNKAPAGVSITKGAVFNGSFNTGSPLDPDRICAGSTVNYELTPPTGFTNAGFGTTWAITDMTFATANGTPAKDTVITAPSSSGNGNLRFTPVASLADSTLILTITVQNISTGCDTTFSRYVSVGYQPVANFGFRNVCYGSGMTFSDSSISNTSTQYLYYFGDGRTSSVKNPVHFYNLPGTYNVSLVLSNNNGCKDSIVKTVTVYPAPDADFTVADACGTNNIQITNNSTVASGTLSYMWYFGNGDTSTAQSPVYAYPAPGTYNIKLVVSGGNNCKDSISKSITIFPAPNADFDADTSTCQGLSIRFSDSSSSVTGGLARLWNFGDGTTSTATNPFHSFATPGTYNVKLVVTTLDGCEDSVTKQITVNTAPDAAFTAVSTSCSGENVQFTNTSSVSAGTITAYSWSFGDGNTSSVENPAHIYANAGSYTVKLVITSNTGCKDSISRQVIVNNAAVANFASVSVCSNSSAQFIDSSSVAGGTIVSRKWYFGDGDSSASMNPSHVYDSAGTYNVTLVVTSNNGCTDSVTKSVSIFAMPVAGFNVSDVCIGNDVVFTNTSTIANDTLSYLWIFGDGDSSTAMNPVHSYPAPGKYTVTLLAMTSNQCADTVSATVNVYEAPSANFTSSANGATVTFTATDSSVISHVWYFGDGDSSTLAMPEHTYATDSLYTVRLVVRNRNGCEAEFSDTVRVRSTGIFDAVKAEIALNIFPNPFREQTNIVYTLEKAARVKAAVYDLNGKEVAVLADQNQSAGNYTYTLDAETNKMNSGLYLIRVMVDNQVITKQIVRLK